MPFTVLVFCEHTRKYKLIYSHSVFNRGFTTHEFSIIVTGGKLESSKQKTVSEYDAYRMHVDIGL